MARFAVVLVFSLGIAALAPAAETPDKHVDENFVLTEPNNDIEANRKSALKLIGTDKIVFVKRFSYSANHYYTEYLNSAWRPGGNLAILDLKTGEITDICPKEMEAGVFGRFDLSFDAKKIVFAFKATEGEGYRIYEIGVDGKNLRRVLNPPKNEADLIAKYRLGRYHHGTDDMDPCYLPDGGICFISTRCQYGILCNNPDDFTTTVLYRINGDGGELRKLTNSSVSEATPCVLPDGRIMYTRWEYVDKGAVSVKCLWSMRADGSGSAEVYGNDISLPPTMIQGRPIPGHANQYVVLGTPHYPHGIYGTVIRLDMNRDIRSRDPMTYITPYVDIRSEGGFHFRDKVDDPWKRDGGGTGPLFRDPFPLSMAHFLTAHKPKGFGSLSDPKGYALYMLDERGQTYLLHRDAEISCYQPVPLKPREKPPVLKGAFDEGMAEKGMATCVVTDVYHGMEDVDRGTVKYLRVLEQVPRAWTVRRRWPGDSHDQQHATISDRTHLGLKVQHGVVPVEKDGSAHFVVPAEKNIYFQALDADYMALQTERTYVNYMPGEIRACIGCHETPEAGPPNLSPKLLATRREPSVPGPQLGEKSGNRPLHYPTDVQPVLDKHCVKCHSGEKPKAGMDLSGTMTAKFSVSYEQLLRKRLSKSNMKVVPIIGENHPKTGNVHYLPARSLGSHASPLTSIITHGKVRPKSMTEAEAARVEELVKEHKKLELTPEEVLRITNWIDTNGQFYGSYYGRRNIVHKEHANFRPVPSWESAIGIPPLPEEER